MGYWQNPLRQLILSLKYRRLRVIGGYLVELLVSSLKLAGVVADVVVPVPLNWRRSWQRGFNQAELLASGVAGQMGWRFANPLVRQRPTRPQFGLKRNERQENVAGAFLIRPRQVGLIRGKIVVVVDDVVATGSTINECAKALRQEGAKDVWGLVIARA